MSEIKAKGKNPGIYGSKYMWQSIFGSTTACHTVSSQPLWYAHYDDKASFADFSAFGGWTKPHMKQYLGDTTLCGAGVDKNFVWFWEFSYYFEQLFCDLLLKIW